MPGTETNSQRNFEKFKDDPKVQKKIDILRNRFEKLLKRCKTDYASREGWKKLKINPKGKVTIRCQAMIANSVPPKQCDQQARKNRLLCTYHCHSKDLYKEIRKMEREQAGIYKMDVKHALKDELESLGQVSEEELKSVDSELVLTIALLRKYLKENTDRQIKRSPGRLLWIIDKLVTFKRTKWEMAHAPEVSFSIEQVNYVLASIRVILFKIVKDEKMIAEIGQEMGKLGIKIKTAGFSPERSLQTSEKGI